MKANDTQIRICLEGTKQFIVPLFQRTYSWKKENIQKLWEDLEDTKNGNEATHFFGSFVTMPVPSSASGVSKYILIDGQQRLVTIFIFLATLRNRIIEIQPGYKKRDEINELYLINKYHIEDKYKVVPTQADRNIFFSILNEVNPSVDNNHLIIETYKFFSDKLSTTNDINEITSLKDTILSKFSVVDIRLEDGDDPYLIFESLNATGTPLTQADLVRNYLFMRLNPDNQQKVYDELWFPMQQKLRDNLESFVRHYLSMDGNVPNFNKIYTTFKENADSKAKSQEDVINLIKGLLKISSYYYNFLHPKKEKEQKLRIYFEKFNKIEVTTSYPLLLRLYEDYTNKKTSADDFSECLHAIETFVVRRAVCGIPTNALNKYFPTVYNSLDQTDITQSLKNKLKSGMGARRMPDDDEFKQCQKEGRLYGNKILRYLLEEIEKYDNKEVVNFEELQIEHIMPQTLSDEWKKELGSNWELIHKKYVDTLGNLTLTGYNQEYSRKLFKEKRDMEKGFKDSGLQLNRDLAKLDKWTENEIIHRAEGLAEEALKVWYI